MGTRWFAACLLSFCFSIEGLASELTLSWSDNSTNELGFEIERKNLGESFELLDTVETDIVDYTDSSVIPGLLYEYRVRAFNDFGYSAYTNVLVTSLENTPPEILTIAGSDSSQDLSISFQKGEPIDPIVIEIADAETDLSELELEITPFDLTVLPFESLEYSIQGNAILLEIDSLAAQVGSTTLSFIASDGVESAEASVNLTVAANIAPRISSLGAHSLYDGQTFGPHAFTILDDDTLPENIVVTSSSSNEELIPSANVQIGGTGLERTITVAVPIGSTGPIVVYVHVNDGVNNKTAPLTLNVDFDAVPTITGFDQAYTIPAGGRLDGIPFTVGDTDHGTSQLEITFSSNNSLLFPPNRSKIKGTGSIRTIDFVPAQRGHGTATVYVTVSDGIKTAVSEPISVTVLPPDVSVEMIEFRVEAGYGVAEVASRPGAVFTLQRTYSLIGDFWETVEDVEVIVEGDSTFLRDPLIIEQAVCYRVFASE